MSRILEPVIHTTQQQKDFGLIEGEDVAAIFNAKPRSLRDWWVKKKGFPKPIITGDGGSLYRCKDISDWIADQKP